MSQMHAMRLDVQLNLSDELTGTEFQNEVRFRKITCINSETLYSKQNLKISETQRQSQTKPWKRQGSILLKLFSHHKRVKESSKGQHTFPCIDLNFTKS